MCALALRCSAGNEGLQEYVDDVKLSNKGMRGKFGKPGTVHQRKPSTIAEDSTNDVLAPPTETAADAAQPALSGDPSVRSEGGDPSVRSVLRGGRALSGADSVQPVNTLARMRGTGDSFDLARRETGDPSMHAVGWAHGPDARQPAALAQQAQQLHTPMATVSAVELRDAQEEAAELPGALNPKEGGDAAPAAAEGGDEGLPSPSGRRQLGPVRPKHTFAAGSQNRNVLGSMYLPAMAQSNINRCLVALQLKGCTDPQAFVPQLAESPITALERPCSRAVLLAVSSAMACHLTPSAAGPTSW